MDDYSYIDNCLLCGKNKQSSGKKVQLFRFPQDVDRCRAWVKAIGIQSLLFLPIDELRQQVLCADHFDPQYINEKLKRLHKLAIPKTPLLPLADALMNNFPIKDTGSAPAMNNFRDIEHSSTKPVVAPTILNAEPVIDFGRPLMNSLETLLHNERHAVVQPAGTLYNTISVPLMSYTGSLDRGNVSAADSPGNAFKFPLPIIEVVNHDDNVAAMTRTAVDKVAADSAPGSLKPNNELLKDMAHSTHTNAFVGSCKPNSIISEYRVASTAKEVFKKPLGTVKPNLKSVDKAYRIPKLSGSNVSFGLKTLITANPRKANINSNVIDLGGTLNPSIGTTQSRYQGIRQYANNKLTIHKNIPLAPIKPATAASLNPAPAAPINTAAAAPFNPAAAALFNPATAALFNQAEAIPFNPDTAALFNSATAAPFNPATAAPFNPATAAPFYPATAASFNPVTAAAFNPATADVPQTRATAMSEVPNITTTSIINKDDVNKRYTDFFSSNTLYIPTGLVKSKDGTLIQIFKPMSATTQCDSNMSLVPNTTFTTQRDSNMSLVPNITFTTQRGSNMSLVPNTTFTTQRDSNMSLVPNTTFTTQRGSNMSLVPNTTFTTQRDSNMSLVPNTTFTTQRGSNMSLVPNTTFTTQRGSNMSLVPNTTFTTQRDSNMSLVPNTTFTTQRDSNMSLVPNTTFTTQRDSNMSLVPNTTFTTQRDSNMSLVPNTTFTTQRDSDMSLVPNTTFVQSREATANSMSEITLDSPATISSNASLESPGPAETELVFVPYTQYEGTISSDSINAHTGEGTEEYGLPLMNCVGTVFQGNIQYTDKIEESDTIDVPLMRCLKTLENANIP